ncbi:CapA family protein [Solirubrobacter ginsenosidimutans]|uniref:CapA family protein n=1 Tax=Solirubrobacter ginsenosidimutans TaxID=490573 RepID=A0A9X3S6Z8_9ACTN|nr:CapA family protein [Solirubrobacter ginsenosidimutans]MDA0165616.1 CapA family protein [Solirubrobacter ginsenosidimutans]
MRLIGTTRTAVAVLLLVLASLAPSWTGETPVTADAVAAAAPKRAPKPVSIAWGGDVTLGSSYGNPPDAGRPLLTAGTEVLKAANLAAVNYEGTFGPGGASKCAGGAKDCFAFQAPPGNAKTLRRAGVDIVNHANNHAFDYGALGWRSTRDALSKAKVEATGAPGELKILSRNGTRVAFLGFSTYAWTNAMGDDAAVAARVKSAAEQADIVVAFLHAGAEGADKQHVPRGPERAFGEFRGDSRHFAHTAIDAGADLVLGSGPHVLRGLELYKNRLVAYSLGNLAGWHNFGTGGRSSLSAIITVALGPAGRFYAARIASFKLDGAGVPHADRGRGAVKLIKSLSRGDFPRSDLKIDRSGLVTATER